MGIVFNNPPPQDIQQQERYLHAKGNLSPGGKATLAFSKRASHEAGHVHPQATFCEAVCACKGCLLATNLTQPTEGLFLGLPRAVGIRSFKLVSWAVGEGRNLEDKMTRKRVYVWSI